MSKNENLNESGGHEIPNEFQLGFLNCLAEQFFKVSLCCLKL